ncbi:MAG: CHRD domain-containing protein [Chitinophagales bacterium]
MKNIWLLTMPFLLFLVACKKELRTKIYPLRAYNNSGMTGQVSFIETTDKSSVTVRLEADGLQPNTMYLSHLHTGTPGNLTGTLIYFNHVESTSSRAVIEEAWALTFDEALQSNTCFTVHNPAFFSNDTIGYVLAGNTGANAQ